MIENQVNATQVHTKEIEVLIEQLIDAWLNNKFESLDMFFHPHVVMMQPGTTKKIIGRERVIDNYREFAEMAELSDYQITDLVIDVFDTTAVALYSFRIRYRYDTTNFDEIGTEILVFHRNYYQCNLIWCNQLSAHHS